MMLRLKEIMIAALMGLFLSATPAGAQDEEEIPRLIVVELFTSHMCPSCPPADNHLVTLAEDYSHLLLPLSFHVDYWNRGSRQDPYSSADFTKRQRIYGRSFDQDGLYTPQVVVDGLFEGNGANKNAIGSMVKKAVDRAYDVPIDVSKTKAGYKITVDAIQGDVPTSYLTLVTFDSRRTSGGIMSRRVDANVVKTIRRLEQWDGKRISVTIPASQLDAERAAVILQKRGQGQVLGVSLIR